MLSADYFTRHWYILWEGKKEGPYSCSELKADLRVTPDTLVWRKGFKEWVPARTVKELQVLFEDPQDLSAPISDPVASTQGEGALSLEESAAIPPFWWWLLILATILMWIVFLTQPGSR